MQIHKLVEIDNDSFRLLILGLMQLHEPKYVPYIIEIMDTGNLYNISDAGFIDKFYPLNEKCPNSYGLDQIEVVFEYTLTKLLSQYDIKISDMYWHTQMVQFAYDEYTYYYDCYFKIEENVGKRLLDLWQDLALISPFYFDKVIDEVGPTYIDSYVVSKEEILGYLNTFLQENALDCTTKFYQCELQEEEEIILNFELSQCKPKILQWLLKTVHTSVVKVGNGFNLEYIYNCAIEGTSINIDYILECIKVKMQIPTNTKNIPCTNAYLLKLDEAYPIYSKVVNERIVWHDNCLYPCRLTL